MLFGYSIPTRGKTASITRAGVSAGAPHSMKRPVYSSL
jgi:hypothetical protein